MNTTIVQFGAEIASDVRDSSGIGSSGVGVPQTLGDLKEALLDWKEKTPYSAPGDWVFASPATRGKRPLWPDSMLANYIQPIAEAAGLGHIGWHTLRHSFCGWGKSALTLDETKELARHQNIATTSDLYGGMSLDAKRKAQTRLVEYVHREAKKRPKRGAFGLICPQLSFVDCGRTHASD
jgi:hypothetical protein